MSESQSVSLTTKRVEDFKVDTCVVITTGRSEVCRLSSLNDKKSQENQTENKIRVVTCNLIINEGSLLQN